MIVTEDACVRCGMSPCYHCTSTVAYCDTCGTDIGEGDWYQIDGEDICYDCLKKEFLKSQELDECIRNWHSEYFMEG